MAIKNLTDVRRMPRLGAIRLGEKRESQGGKTYPVELEYFKIDPQTPSDVENEKLISEFKNLFGEQPKQIRIMFPVDDTNIFFPQWYKRYGKSTALQCRGDGVEAVCLEEKFTEGLEKIGTHELGNPLVKCNGRECPYFINKKCNIVGTLQVLIPELPGAGVWQISTSSYNSIINVNSCIDYIKAVCGRAHLIPLTLERRKQEISHEGKKRNHFILHVNMNFKLANLQRIAQIDPDKIALSLPAYQIEDNNESASEENQNVDAETIDSVFDKWCIWIDEQLKTVDNPTDEEIKKLEMIIINKVGDHPEKELIVNYLNDTVNKK